MQRKSKGERRSCFFFLSLHMLISILKHWMAFQFLIWPVWELFIFEMINDLFTLYSCFRIHTGDRPYKCAHPGCEKAFTQLSNLQVELNGFLITGFSTSAHACLTWSMTTCESFCLFFSLLKSHQRQHNKDKPFKCTNCYRAYSDSASLQIHVSAHAIKNAKAYCCSMCGRAYTSVSWKCT